MTPAAAPPPHAGPGEGGGCFAYTRTGGAPESVPPQHRVIGKVSSCIPVLVSLVLYPSSYLPLLLSLFLSPSSSIILLISLFIYRSSYIPLLSLFLSPSSSIPLLTSLFVCPSPFIFCSYISLLISSLLIFPEVR